MVQEVSPWDMGFFMDILVRMDSLYYLCYCTVLSAGFGEMNKCFGHSFVDPGHLWLLVLFCNEKLSPSDGTRSKECVSLSLFA